MRPKRPHKHAKFHSDRFVHLWSVEFSNGTESLCGALKTAGEPHFDGANWDRKLMRVTCPDCVRLCTGKGWDGEIHIQTTESIYSKDNGYGTLCGAKAFHGAACIDNLRDSPYFKMSEEQVTCLACAVEAKTPVSPK